MKRVFGAFDCVSGKTWCTPDRKTVSGQRVEDVAPNYLVFGNWILVIVTVDRLSAFLKVDIGQFKGRSVYARFEANKPESLQWAHYNLNTINSARFNSLCGRSADV